MNKLYPDKERPSHVTPPVHRAPRKSEEKPTQKPPEPRKSEEKPAQEKK